MAPDAPTERRAPFDPALFVLTAVLGGFVWSVAESVDLWATSGMRFAGGRQWTLFFLSHLSIGIAAFLIQMGILDGGTRFLHWILRRLAVPPHRARTIAGGLVLFAFHGSVWTAAALTGFDRGQTEGLLLGLVMVALGAAISQGRLPWQPTAPNARHPVLLCAICLAVMVAGHLFNRDWNPKIYFPQHVAVTIAAITCAAVGVSQALRLVLREKLPFSRRAALVVGAALLVAPVPLFGQSNDVRHALFTRAFDAKGLLYIARKVQGTRYGNGVEGPLAVQAANGPKGGGVERVLLVTMDATRADHLGAYGYRRPTSPVIDRLAREGTVFDWAWATGARTSIAIGSIFANDRGLSTLAEVLERAHVPRLVVLNSFLALEAGPHWMEKLADRVVAVAMDDDLAVAAAAVSEIDAGRFQGFMWVHLFGPHKPYVDHAPNRFGTTQMDLYDGEIAVSDRAVGHIVEAIERNGPGGSTAIIFGGDHGEEFRDHGGETHGWDVYNELLHVPLIIKMPGQRPRHEHNHVTQRDLPLTILDLFGIAASSTLRARSLVPAVRGDSLGAERTVIIGPISSFGVGAVMSGRWKLIYCLFNGSHALYDLEQDAAEQLNLFEVKQQIAGPLQETLRVWLNDPTQTTPEIAGTAWSHARRENTTPLLPSSL